MTKTMKYLYIVIGAFGLMHLALGVSASTDDEVARLWFMGSGLAILLISLLGLSGVHRLQSDRIVSTGWIAGNVTGLCFVAYATYLLPEPQNLVLLGLILATVTIALVTIFRFLKSRGATWCCTNSHTITH